MSIVPHSNRWYSAYPAGENEGFNSTQKEELYKETEQQAIAWEQKYEDNKNNPEVLVQLLADIRNSFATNSKWIFTPLGEWIAENSWYGEGPSMELKGAYAPLHRIHELEKRLYKDFSNAMDVEQEQVIVLHANNQYAYDNSLTNLANIDRSALFYVEKLKNKIKFHAPPEVPQLINEIKERIFSFVTVEDLLTLTRTDKCSRELAVQELKKRAKEGMICLDKERKVSWPQDLIDWNITAKRYICLKYLSIVGTHFGIRDLRSQFPSVTTLDLTNLNDQEIFNHLLQKFPSIEILRCDATVLPFTCILTNDVKNFDVLKNCPLKTIQLQGDFKSIQGLGSCTTLENVIINNCIDLIDYKELKNLPNLTHLTISKSGISEIKFHLPKLVYLHIGSQFVFNNFHFLEGSPNLKTLVVEDDCLDIDQMDYLGSILSLKLIGFSNSVIAGLHKCVSLTTLELDTNLKKDPLNLFELNHCFTLQTLILENCTLANIGVLSIHPSLKQLHVKNCGAFAEEAIELLKWRGIEVFEV